LRYNLAITQLQQRFINKLSYYSLIIGASRIYKRKGVNMKQQNFMARDPFFFQSGEKVQSLQEFIDVLKKADEGTFNFHVNKEKNDFAAWIRYSMNNQALAGKISLLNTKEDMLKAIYAYLGIKKIPGIIC
jgi:hypothetical protein